jgi:hypothetical protein
MKIHRSHYLPYLILFLITVFWTSPSYAELYKWIDANGQTHYSDKKQNLGKAVIKELKLKDSYNGGPIAPSSKPSPIKSEIELIPEPNNKVLPANIISNYGGGQLETDATRCALAREVLEGTVRHGSGAITDDHDKKVANRDVKKFCH